jgi:hypothetical protein
MRDDQTMIGKVSAVAVGVAIAVGAVGCGGSSFDKKAATRDIGSAEGAINLDAEFEKAIGETTLVTKDTRAFIATIHRYRAKGLPKDIAVHDLEAMEDKLRFCATCVRLIEREREDILGGAG